MAKYKTGNYIIKFFDHYGTEIKKKSKTEVSYLKSSKKAKNILTKIQIIHI